VNGTLLAHRARTTLEHRDGAASNLHLRVRPVLATRGLQRIHDEVPVQAQPVPGGGVQQRQLCATLIQANGVDVLGVLALPVLLGWSRSAPAGAAS
jgi:hypothetical protein